MLFERTALSRKPEALIRRELAALREQGELSPALVFRDPYMLDFLELADTYSERDLESAILREIERFLLELGAGFAFASGRSASRSTATTTTSTCCSPPAHAAARCHRAQIGDFKPADSGQMELYLRWLDRHERQPSEQAPLGIVLCAGKKRETVEYLDLDQRGIHVAEYLTELPPREVLEDRLHRAIEAARNRLILGGHLDPVPAAPVVTLTRSRGASSSGSDGRGTCRKQDPGRGARGRPLLAAAPPRTRPRSGDAAARPRRTLPQSSVLRSPAMQYVALACWLLGACAGRRVPRPARSHRVARRAARRAGGQRRLGCVRAVRPARGALQRPAAGGPAHGVRRRGGRRGARGGGTRRPRRHLGPTAGCSGVHRSRIAGPRARPRAGPVRRCGDRVRAQRNGHHRVRGPAAVRRGRRGLAHRLRRRAPAQARRAAARRPLTRFGVGIVQRGPGATARSCSRCRARLSRPRRSRARPGGRRDSRSTR